MKTVINLLMHELVELVQVCPDILLDILYATPHNFTGKAVYHSARCFLLKKVADRLVRVQKTLKKKGFGLKVFDGYRPLSVQKIFWELFPDPRYVADPAVDSKHNRGTAVDLTLVDHLGRDLPMPTNFFDDFTERAHRGYRGCSPEATHNSQLLEAAMVEQGFIPYIEEWWHFDDPDWQNHPILDIPIEPL